MCVSSQSLQSLIWNIVYNKFLINGFHIYCFAIKLRDQIIREIQDTWYDEGINSLSLIFIDLTQPIPYGIHYYTFANAIIGISKSYSANL